MIIALTQASYWLCIYKAATAAMIVMFTVIHIGEFLANRYMNWTL